MQNHDLPDNAPLSQICYVRFSGSINDVSIRRSFFNELVLFQKLSVESRRHVVTVPAIRSWLLGKKLVEPRRNDAVRFLAEYAVWMRSKGLVPLDNNYLCDQVIAELGRFAHIDSRESKSNARTVDPLSLALEHIIIPSSTRIPRVVEYDLFRDGNQSDIDDKSFYLLFRLSTKNSAVLKSFLVLRKPGKSRKHYTFNHFLWGGTKYKRHIFRECEGFLLKFQKSYYFVGYNYTVHADKNIDPAMFNVIRARSKEVISGLGMIACEYDDINDNPGLFGGLTMTVASNAQPVVGRIAFLHLGTSYSLGKNIIDTDVQPGEIPRGELAADLRSVLDNLKRLGCKRFGVQLSYDLNSQWEEISSDELATSIINMVNNVPAWDLSRENVSGEKRPGDGSIETYSSSGNRPRD